MFIKAPENEGKKKSTEFKFGAFKMI